MLEPIADMPQYLLGMTILHGKVVPVVDARRLIGDGPTTPPARLVSLRVDDRRVALAFDDVIGIRDVDEAAAPAPPLLGETASDVIERIGVLDSQLLVVLRASRILRPGVA